MQLVSANPTLTERIVEFVKAADEVVAAHWVEQGFTFSPPPTHRADYLSDKWVKVVTVEHQHDGTQRASSVYAFIALQDGETKALGTIRQGNIHKSASFKAPAKHARGNVFADDFRKCLTPYGIVYLK